MRNILSFLKKPWVYNGAAVLLILIIVGIYYATRTPVVAPAPAAEVAGPVTVVDQAPGMEVHVASVDVPAPGVWVAVQPVTEFGVGNVWGAARTRDARTDVVVPMVLPTLPHSDYVIVLYRDNGDDVFDRATDSVYIDFETGERVETRFATFAE